jgi:hypothetical protein
MNSFLKKHLSFQLVLWLMIVLNGAVILFHVTVLTGIIPFTHVWGGQLENRDQMLLFESISLLINGIIGWVLFTKLKPERFYLSEKVANFILYGLAALFLINTVGNIFAEATMEQVIATPLTLFSALCCYRLAIDTSRKQLKADPL